MFLNCRNRYNRLVVKKTFYGRDNNRTCSSKLFDTDKLCAQATPDTIKQKVDLMCSGEYKCKVPVSPAFLEQKGNYICPSTRKYLQVTYACHQDPKLHMICRNCSSSCWPLCQKECCEPPIIPLVTNVQKAPEELTCHEGCPNHCAPQCDMACCASNVLGVGPDNSKRPIVNSCKGDCKNLCAPLCRPSCCSRHKKNSAKVRAQHLQRRINYHRLPPRRVSTIATTCPVDCHGNCLPHCDPSCCRQIPLNQHPYYVEPLSARIQRTQCAGACHPSCAPLCAPECCRYMNQLRSIPNPPVQAQAPLQPMIPQPQVQSDYATQAVARTGYGAQTSPQQTEYPNINQPPLNLVTSQTLEVEVPNVQYQYNDPQQTYQRILPQQPVANGCPQSCATSCDSNCKLGCCVNPNSYVFTTPMIGDEEQRRTYELLLAKYRTNQLAKYYQNRGMS